MAYTHHVGLEVPNASLAQHVARARERCVNEPALQCVLLAASTNQTRQFREGDIHTGALHMRLPHAVIVPFVNALTQPLPGEGAGAVQVLRQSTDAEDLGQPIADAEKRHAQLTEYRDRLHALAARPDIHVDDLIKIASELSQVQSQLEAADGQQRDLATRVDTEELYVDYSTPNDPGAADPIHQAWANGAETFANNAGAALEFSIASLPWLPLAALALFALRLARRLVIGRASRAKQGSV